MRGVVCTIVMLSWGLALSQSAPSTNGQRPNTPASDPVVVPKSGQANVATSAKPTTPAEPKDQETKKVATTNPPVTKAECAPNPVKIGQPITCTVTIIHRDSVSVALSGPETIEILPGDDGVPHGAGRKKTVRSFIVRPTSMRKVFVKDVEVIWREPDGAEGRTALPVQRIPVTSLMANETDPQFKTFVDPQGSPDAFWAAHGPVPHRVISWTGIIISSAIVVILLGIGIGFLVRRWLESRRGEEPEYVDPRPAHIIAFEALDLLAHENLPQQGKVGEYYVRVSEILRGYLERRFNINGLEMTSDEIRLWSRSEDLSPEVRLGIDAFLADSDLVKFADFQPSSAAVETIARQARGLIALTKTVADASAAQSRHESSVIDAPTKTVPDSGWMPPNQTRAPLNDDEQGPS